MRFFLGAHGPGLALVGIIEPGFLIDLAAVLQQRDLAAGLIIDGLLDEAHRVHVLDFAARPQMAEILRRLIFFILAGPTDRDVHIRPQVAVLHVAVAGAQIPQDLAQFHHIGGGFLGTAQVGARDDLHQGDAGAVQIDEGQRRVHVMDRLARVLFDMDPFDPHPAGDARAHLDQHLALADQRVIELRNLIPLRQIGIEIVLAVKGRAQIDLRLQPQTGAHRLFDAEFVDHRQHARHRRIDKGDVGIGFGAEGGRGAGEQLGPAGDLGVNLHADDDFPVAGGPGNHLGLGGVKAEIEHVTRPFGSSRRF